MDEFHTMYADLPRSQHELNDDWKMKRDLCPNARVYVDRAGKICVWMVDGGMFLVNEFKECSADIAPFSG